MIVIPNETDQTVTVTETAEPEPTPDHPAIDIELVATESIKLDESTESIKSRDTSIGSIYDQFLVEYIVRLVCYKFLLTGQDQKLKLDNIVRVSIKNLSLLALSNCIRIYPQILLMKLTVTPTENVTDKCCEKLFDDISEICLPEKSECRDDELLLDIKPDHFGTSTCSLDEFLSPLSDSGASVVKSVTKRTKSPSNKAVIVNLNPNESHNSEVEKSDQNIEDILLYFNHHDPSLRGNVQSIIGNFIVAVLEDYQSVDKFCEKFSCNVDTKFISFGLLLKMLMKVKNTTEFYLFFLPSFFLLDFSYS